MPDRCQVIEPCKPEVANRHSALIGALPGYTRKTMPVYIEERPLPEIAINGGRRGYAHRSTRLRHRVSVPNRCNALAE
jgi:hypothetical protein